MAWDLQEAAAYYRKQGAPGDQNALIAFLREAQQENGGSIPEYLLEEVSRAIGAKEPILRALIRRIPSLRLGNTHCLELCAGPNCGKHTKLAEYAETLQKDCGNFTLKYVPCMRMCGKGPNLKWDGTLYHQADETLIQTLVNQS